ncbi:hypothetical protein MLM_3270 [Mycobacterium lepraemurium]|nr:hypothetical protein MLM_3270 [Mycobacterium lepraemurium]
MKYVDVDGVGRLSRIGPGTWQFGSREWGYGDSYAAGAAGDIMRHALALGVTLFDTAEIYGFGKSERILGDALGEQRAEVAVASKIMPVAPFPAAVRQRARASARRLGLDRIRAEGAAPPRHRRPARHHPQGGARGSRCAQR